MNGDYQSAAIHLLFACILGELIKQRATTVEEAHQYLDGLQKQVVGQALSMEAAGARSEDLSKKTAEHLLQFFSMMRVMPLRGLH